MTEQQFDKNSWQTPPECAVYVKRRWAVKWDGAATVENKICDYFITPEIDFLNFENIDSIIENQARIFINQNHPIRAFRRHHWQPADFVSRMLQPTQLLLKNGP